MGLGEAIWVLAGQVSTLIGVILLSTSMELPCKKHRCQYAARSSSLGDIEFTGQARQIEDHDHFVIARDYAR
mgnify:CR=1 FL=1